MRWCLSSICFQWVNQERQDEKWQSNRHKYYFLLSHLRMRIRLLHINNRIVRPPPCVCLSACRLHFLSLAFWEERHDDDDDDNTSSFSSLTILTENRNEKASEGTDLQIVVFSTQFSVVSRLCSTLRRKTIGIGNHHCFLRLSRLLNALRDTKSS